MSSARICSTLSASGKRPPESAQITKGVSSATLSHALRPDGHGQRDRGQQASGHQRHGGADREEERVAQREHKEQHADAQGHGRDHPDNALQFPRQRAGRGLDPPGQRRDFGEPGAAAGDRDNALGLAVDQEGPAKNGVPRRLGDGFAFAGEHRFIHRAAGGLHQTEVRRDPVPRQQHQGVVRDQLGGVDLDDPAVAADRDHGREQLAEPGGRMLGPLLLNVGEYPVDHDHDDDRDGQLRHSGHVGQHGGAPEHDGEEVGHFGQQPAPAGGRAARGQRVGPELLQPPRRFRRTKAWRARWRSAWPPGGSRRHHNCPGPLRRNTVNRPRSGSSWIERAPGRCRWLGPKVTAGSWPPRRSGWRGVPARRRR